MQQGLESKLEISYNKLMYYTHGMFVPGLHYFLICMNIVHTYEHKMCKIGLEINILEPNGKYMCHLL